MKKENFRSSLSILQRAYRISVTNSSLSKFQSCDIFLSPPGLINIMTLGTNHLQEAFDLGYKAAKEQEAQLSQLRSTDQA
jgi:NTE family protein